MKSLLSFSPIFVLGASLLLLACMDTSAPLISASVASRTDKSAHARGPETPNFNLEVILRSDGKGFGHVNFRQPNDDQLIINLDTWVRDLSPNTSYLLQRAVDTNLEGNCTSTSWLTLSKGPKPQAIVTDEKGTGTAYLFRSVAAFPVGTTFDIHFRVINAQTSAVVLTSDCYQFTISQ